MMNAADSRVAPRHQPYACQVQPLGQPVPAEDPDPEERGLEEEGEEALHRQRAAEDVAYVARVCRPVHAELEFLHEPGHDPHGDVDEQQGSEETGQPAIGLLSLPVPGGLEQRHEKRESDRHRDEEEVVDARRCNCHRARSVLTRTRLLPQPSLAGAADERATRLRGGRFGFELRRASASRDSPEMGESPADRVTSRC